MKVTTTQILDGIQKYIEHDVLGKIPDARKWLVGGYVALIMMPYRQNPDALMNHPLVKPLCEDGTVDIDADIAEAFLLELPMRHLCKEDCPGLCPKCGKRLAEGDCGCKNEKEIDPRLKVLQKLLEKPE